MTKLKPSLISMLRLLNAGYVNESNGNRQKRIITEKKNRTRQSNTEWRRLKFERSISYAVIITSWCPYE